MRLNNEGEHVSGSSLQANRVGLAFTHLERTLAQEYEEIKNEHADACIDLLQKWIGIDKEKAGKMFYRIIDVFWNSDKILQKTPEMYRSHFEITERQLRGLLEKQLHTSIEEELAGLPINLYQHTVDLTFQMEETETKISTLMEQGPTAETHDAFASTSANNLEGPFTEENSFLPQDQGAYDTTIEDNDNPQSKRLWSFKESKYNKTPADNMEIAPRQKKRRIQSPRMSGKQTEPQLEG